MGRFGDGGVVVLQILSQSLHRGAEARLLPGEDLGVRCQVEDPGHEVLACGVLLQPAHQIGDGHIELGRTHSRHVEQQLAHILADRSLLFSGHPLQHLELEPVADPLLGAEQVGEGDVEQVVPGDPEPDSAHPFCSQQPVQHQLIVGICGFLGLAGDHRPVVNIGVDSLHG